MNSTGFLIAPMSSDSQFIVLKKYPSILYWSIRKPLLEHDFRQIGEYKMEDLAAYAIGNNEEIVGGVLGQIGLGRLYIENNWVHEDYRNQGLGSQLLTKIEKHAHKEGMKISYLTTTNYLARSFYEKRGYKIFAELPFYNPNSEGVEKEYLEYSMVKML